MRSQPLLLVAACVVSLPAVIAGPPPAAVALLVSLVLVSATVLWVLERRDRLAPVVRRRAASALRITGVGTLAAVLLSDAGAHPAGYVLVAAALCAVFASTPGGVRRWALQVTAISSVAVALRLSDREVADVVFVLSLLCGVAGLAELFTRELVRARRAITEQRRAAERRAELLETARQLPGRSVEDGARAVTRALRDLAFDAAGISLIEDDTLVSLHLDNIPDLEGPIPRGSGIAWEAIAQDRTVVLADYHASAERLPARDEVRAVVVTPVRSDGETVGGLMCARFDPGEPTAAEIEIAEVLAAHLGAVIGAEQRLARQRQLFDRVAELDRMRSGLVSAVSAEVRDPLTIVRGAAATLRTYGDRIEEEDRRTFLERLATHSQDLRRVVDAILAYSQLQARRREPQVAPTPLTEVLALVERRAGAPAVAGASPTPGRSPAVVVDPELLELALELLIVPDEHTSGLIRVDVGDDALEIERSDSHDRPLSSLTRSLGAQLLLAGGAELAGDDPVRARLPFADGTTS